MGSFTLDGYGRPTTTPDGSTITWSTDGEETSITPTTGGATHFAYSVVAATQAAGRGSAAPQSRGSS